MESTRAAESHRLDTIEHQESLNSSHSWQFFFQKRSSVFLSLDSHLQSDCSLFGEFFVLDRRDLNMRSALLRGCLGYLLSSPAT